MKHIGQSEETREGDSQAQQEQVDQQVSQEQQQIPAELEASAEEGTGQEAGNPAVAGAAPPEKRKRRRKRQVTEEEVSVPHSSYWPLALALALSVLLFGAVSHPVVLAIGVVLIIAAVVGWSLERRR